MKIFGFEIRKITDSVPISKLTTEWSAAALNYFPTMTVDQLMANATVNACTGIISDAVSVLPVRVFRRLPDGGRKLETSSPIYNLLKLRPNPVQMPITFKSQVMMHLLLRGNAFIFIDRDAKGTPTGLYALAPQNVEIHKYTDKNAFWYRYTIDGKTYDLTSDEILHIPAMIWSGPRGLSPIEYSYQSASLGNTMDKYTARSFDGGIHSKLKVTVPKDERNFNAEDAKKLKDRLIQAYGGPDHAGEPFILTQGMTAEALNLPSNNDSQLAENRTYSTKEVAKIFRVPLSMLGESDAKYNNNEQQQRNFLQLTLNPWLRRLEEYFGLLLPIYDREDCYVEFDRNAMLQADSNIRIENYVKQFTNGQISLNDINRMENRPLIDPAIGDVRFAPVNLAPLTKEYIDAYMAQQKLAIKNAGEGDTTAVKK